MLNSSSQMAFDYLIKHKPLYTLILSILSLVSTACNIIGTILLVPIFSILIGSQRSPINFPNWQADNFLTSSNLETKLLVIVASLLALIVIKNIASYGSRVIGFQHTKSIASAMRNQGLNLLSQVDFEYYQTKKLSAILTKLNRETDKASLAIKSIHKIAIILLTIVIVVGILILLSWQLTLIAALASTAMLMINNWLTSRVTKARNASIEVGQEPNRQIIEFLAGIRAIKTMAREIEACEAISMSFARKQQQQLRTQLVSAAVEPLTEVGGMAMILALIIVGYYIHVPTASTAASILPVYLAIFWRLLPFIGQLERTRLQYLTTRSSLEVVAGFLNPNNKPISDTGDLCLVNSNTEIEFAAVSFAYPHHAQIILDKIDLTIPAGKTTALVGFPGTGSSPITELLTKFYEPIEGKISLDGRDIQGYEPRNLRKAIAVVSRETFIFNASLADNIAYGLDCVAEQDILAAAGKAKLARFIAQLPTKLATQVGDRGIALSEAQKQKIGLARAFLRNPKIVILDEPFDLLERDFIDFESVQEIITALTHKRTTIIITKQLELAKISDRIVLFNRGRIVETGTHQELLQQGSTYHRLYSMQFKSNQQSRQMKLAQKIARKLAQQDRDYLSAEIRLNLNSLIGYLDSLSQGTISDEEQNIMLDESFLSAKDMLASLKAYGSKISRGKLD